MRPTSYSASLSFLLSQVGARSAQLFAERLNPLSISPRSYAVLSHLVEGGISNQQQLSDALGIHRNNMVALIDEMERVGWVKRHRSELDRRAFEVRLTTKGSVVVSEIDRLVPGLDEQLATQLSESEQRLLVGLLFRMANALGLQPGIHPYLSNEPG